VRRNSSFAAVILFILVCNNLFSQSEIPLDYNRFLTDVLKNNPLIKQAENVSKIGEFNYRAAQGNFDPAIGGTFDNKFFGGANYHTVLNSEVRQQLYSSQYLKFGYEYGVGSNLNPERYTSKQGLPYLGIEVGLLQGLVIDKNRANVLKAREYKNYYNSEQNIRINDILLQSSLGYFQFLFTLKQVSLNNYFLFLADQRLKGIEDLAKVGERAPIDTVEAAVLYQSRQLDFQNSILDNQKSGNELFYFIFMNENGSPSQGVIEPTDSLDGAYRTARKKILGVLLNDTINNPVIAQYQSFRKILEIDQRFKKEMIKPRLDVNYNFLYQDAQFNPLFSTNNYKWGASLSFPLFLRTPRNEYKTARLSTQNVTFELNNKVNQIDFKKRILIQNLRITDEQIQIAQRSVRYNRQMVVAEQLRFDNGESSLFLLNMRENRWLESELKSAQYKLKYLGYYLELIHLNGDQKYLFD